MSEKFKNHKLPRTAALLGLFALIVATFFFAGGIMADGPANAIANGGFENGDAGWLCKRCSLNVGPPAVEGSAAGHFKTTKSSGRGQVFYKNVTLQANTEYTLSFWAKSPKNRTVRAYVEQQRKPRANYGLKNAPFKLTADWQQYSVTFTTKNFNNQVSDARLRLRFDRGKGHEYSIDNLMLSSSDAPPPEPTATPTGEPPTPTAEPPTPTATPPPPPPPGGGDELLIFDFNDDVTKGYSGFIMDKTSALLAQDWTQPVDYAHGTAYVRAHIMSIPVDQPGLKLGWCFWQKKVENCRGHKIPGVPGTIHTWTMDPQDMWTKNGKVDFSQPRTKMGFIIRDGNNHPVSLKTSDDWGGNDPDEWYPMGIRYTMVLVAPGETFSGWNNYIP